MYLSDKPIESYEDDILNRGAFVKQMAKALISYSSSDTFTISLCGEWGCGKSSILNMTKKEIEELSKNFDNDEKPIVVVFNPWNFTSCEQLLTQFFSLLSASINKKGAIMKDLSNAIKKYASLFEYASLIPGTPKIVELLSKITKNLAKNTGAKNNLSYQREVITKLLKKLKRKIIVIIDDIDRLNNEQIRLIFQLVNSIAGFPNMIYLLAFDKKVVVRALEQEQNCNGEEYLEKIIQVPFYVPKVSKSKTLDYLESILNDIWDKDIKSTIDMRHWQNIKTNCIAPFVSSIRDVNRIINSYKFKFDLLKNEVNCVDLLALTVIEVQQNRLFQWIRTNLDILTQADRMIIIEEMDVGQEKLREKYLLQMQEIDSNNAEALLSAVETLFTNFANHLGHTLFGIFNHEQYLRGRNIACRERAKIYFSLQLEDIPLTKSQINEILHNYTEKQLIEIFTNSVNYDMTIDYIIELTPFVSEINEKRRLFFFKTMLSVIMLPKANEDYSSKYLTTAEYCVSFVEKFFLEDDVEANIKLLNDTLDSLEKKSITALSRIIYRIKCLLGDYGEEERIHGFGFTDCDEFRDFEKRYISTISKLEKTDLIRRTYNNTFLHSIWRKVDLESYEQFIAKLLSDSANIPNVLMFFTPLAEIPHTERYNFNKTQITKYTTLEEVYRKISSLKHSKSFREFDDKEKRITVEFADWYDHRENDPRYFSNEDTIKQLIAEWESELVTD